MEWIAALAVLSFVVVDLWGLATHGYLPQPFLYDVGAPLIGLHETAYWADGTRTYAVGRQVYPPLPFLVMRMVSDPRCYGVGPAAGRECDVNSQVFLMLAYLAGVWASARAFLRLDRATAIPRTVILMLGLPMLYGLECGNLIILTFVSFALAEAPHEGRIAAAVFRALSINLKPYLLVLLAPDLIARRWTTVLPVAALSLALYLITWSVFGSGSPLDLLLSLRQYAVDVSHRAWSNVYFATSYWPLIRILDEDPAFLGLASPLAAQVLAWVLRAAIWTAQVGVVACCVVAVFRPSQVRPRRLSILLMAAILGTLTTGQSGYVQIFLFFLILTERWQGRSATALFAAVALLSLPGDLILKPVIDRVAASILTHRLVTVHFGVSLGQIARPGLVLTMLYALIAITLTELLTPRESVPAATSPTLCER